MLIDNWFRPAHYLITQNLLLHTVLEDLFLHLILYSRGGEFEIERTDTLLINLEFEFEQKLFLNKKLFFISDQNIDLRSCGSVECYTIDRLAPSDHRPDEQEVVVRSRSWHCQVWNGTIRQRVERRLGEGAWLYERMCKGWNYFIQIYLLDSWNSPIQGQYGIVRPTSAELLKRNLNTLRTVSIAGGWIYRIHMENTRSPTYIVYAHLQQQLLGSCQNNYAYFLKKMRETWFISWIPDWFPSSGKFMFDLIEIMTCSPTILWFIQIIAHSMFKFSFFGIRSWIWVEMSIFSYSNIHFIISTQDHYWSWKLGPVCMTPGPTTTTTTTTT